MTRLLTRGLLITALGLGYAAFYAQPAVADDEGEEEEDSGGEESSGGDQGDQGEDGEEEEEDAKDQPAVTAGGLFTITNYPVRENSRPLTLTRKLVQARLAVGTDLSAKGAFESFGVNVEGIYGYADNFSILGGITNAYNFKQFSFYAGIEGSLYYDVVDFRLAANLHRNAIPQYAFFCNPPATPDEMPVSGSPQCMSPNFSIDALPSGAYAAGGVKFSIDVGFPFRYAFMPEIAIVALHTLMSIDFNKADVDFVTVSEPTTDPMTMLKTQTFTPRPNTAKPDLNPSLGIAANPVPPLSVVLFAQLRIPDFDTSAGAFQIPLTGRIEFSPNQKLDLGLEFTLLNVKPPSGQSVFDNRFLALFMQSRFGT